MGIFSRKKKDAEPEIREQYEDEDDLTAEEFQKGMEILVDPVTANLVKSRGIDTVSVQYDDNKIILKKVLQKAGSAAVPLPGSSREIFLTQIKNLLIGQVTPEFIKNPDKKGEKCSMSIGYDDIAKAGAKLEYANLVFHEEKNLKAWWRCLKKLHREAQKAYHENPMHERREKTFVMVDPNKADAIRLRDVLTVIKDNYGKDMNEQDIKEIFTRCDANKDGKLGKVEFEDFFEQLETSRDTDICLKLWEESKAGTGKRGRMTAGKFYGFLFKDQKEKFDLQHAEALVKRLKHGKGPPILSFLEFSVFVTQSCLNSAVAPEALEVYQDMSKPLRNYYIFCAEHSNLPNPKLLLDCIGNYKQMLKHGVRAFHMDIRFQDRKGIFVGEGDKTTCQELGLLLQAIKREAFMQSPFPVILNLEINVDEKVQPKVVQVLKDSLGFQLRADKTADELTPSNCKSKFLLSCFSKTKTIISDLRDLCILSLTPYETSIRQTLTNCKKLGARAVVDINEHQTERVTGEVKRDDCIAMCQDVLCHYSSSSEKKNLVSTTGWACGMQLVGINMHVSDHHRRLALAQFSINGKCGYVLKPLTMRERDQRRHKEWQDRQMRELEGGTMSRTTRGTVEEEEDPAIKDDLFAHNTGRVNLTIKVITARYLPVDGSSDIPDPYVVVRVDGYGADTRQYTTRTIQNNGYDPVWDEEFEFALTYKECAILSFVIYDKDFLEDDFICQAAVPVRCLRQGYRNIMMLDENGNELPAYPTLVIHVQEAQHGSVAQLIAQINKEQYRNRRLTDTNERLVHQMDEIVREERTVRSKFKEMTEKKKQVEGDLKDIRGDFFYFNEKKWNAEEEGYTFGSSTYKTFEEYKLRYKSLLSKQEHVIREYQRDLVDGYIQFSGKKIKAADIQKITVEDGHFVIYIDEGDEVARELFSADSFRSFEDATAQKKEVREKIYFHDDMFYEPDDDEENSKKECGCTLQ